MNKSMKTLVCAIFAVFAISALAAQQSDERDESKWSDMTCDIVPINRILQSDDAYVVIYAKHHVGSGSTVIPKRWASGNTENPRKLQFRTVSGQLKPFMTILRKGGEFYRVILNVPRRTDMSFWGIAAAGTVEGADKETLEELAMY